jgi:hypothetical protein
MGRASGPNFVFEGNSFLCRNNRVLHPHKEVSNLQLARRPGANGQLVEVPRWQILSDLTELAFEQAVLSFAEIDGGDSMTAEEIKALPPATKLAVLGKFVARALPGVARDLALGIAERGVVGLGDFGSALSLQTRSSAMDQLRSGTICVSGIVQKCGTRGLLGRLWRMGQHELPDTNSSLQVTNLPINPGQPEQVSIAFNGAPQIVIDRFMAMIAPEERAPAIFHIADLGWDLAPHNLLIWRLQKDTPVLLGAHTYTVNIEIVERLA